VDVILSPGEGDQNIGETYISVFAKELPRGHATEINEFYKLFEYAEKVS